MRTINEDKYEIIGNKQKLSTIPGFHGRIKGGGGNLGSCPGAATTKGPPQKNSKKIIT